MGSFLALYSVPLVYVFVFMPVPYCFDYCSFVIYFEIRACDISRFVLLTQDCFGYSGSFVVQMSFRIAFPISVKNAIGIFIEIALNL